MSDLSVLFHEFAKNPVQAVEDFAATEYRNVTHLIQQLPAEVQPVAQEVLTDAKAVLTAGAEWGGTVLEAYITANGGSLATAVANIMSGLIARTGGASGTATNMAVQDTLAGAIKLLNALVTHYAMASAGLALPAPTPPPSISGASVAAAIPLAK